VSVSAYNLLTPGTPLTWKASGGDYAITLTSLANAAARQGAKGDLGAYWRRRWAIHLAASCASAPTAGNQLELWWAGSPSGTAGTDNPGAATGADAAFATPGEYKFQLMFVGALYLSNNLGTGIQKQQFEFFPRFRYGMPVLVNSSGVALGGTAGDHEIRLTPVDDVAASTSAG
jgi:hypothetical protein